jgi:hypothetical protein
MFILILPFKYNSPIVPKWDFAAPTEFIQAKSSNRPETTEPSKSFEPQMEFIHRYVTEEAKLRSHDLRMRQASQFPDHFDQQ